MRASDRYQEIYDAGPEAVRDVLLALEARIDDLTTRLEAVEARLAQNSHNSSRPPSSDPPWQPPRSQRKPSGRLPGGQPGHPGRTLECVAQPDRTVVHRAVQCPRCGASLEAAEVTGVTRRQVFDLPPLALEVTEHLAQTCCCPACAAPCVAPFPDGVSQPVVYGPGLRALVLYLDQYQLLPLARTRQMLADLFGQAPSEGTLVRWRTDAHEGLADLSAALRDTIARQPVVHFDETGARVAGQAAWIHVACTPGLTCLYPHPKRGRQAHVDLGILPDFAGICAHDALASYLDEDYPSQHALCNAHLLRDLQAVFELTGQTWAPHMAALLRALLHEKQAAGAAGQTALSPLRLARYAAVYDRLVALANAKNPSPRLTGKVGRPKRTKACNLARRLAERADDILRFAFDFTAPFDNNQAERDLRLVKLQQKVSGCFRSQQGVETFCRIRSYLATLRKQGAGLFDALTALCRGEPVWPAGVG